MIKVNGEEIKIERFPVGESLIKFGSKMNASVFVEFKYENNGDLIDLMFVKKHLETQFKDAKVNLVIMYMPYSRMDRVEDGETVFTLKYVCEFINSLKFEMVEVIETHSDVTTALLDRCISDSGTDKFFEYFVSGEIAFDKENDFLFFPDAGAYKKYSPKFKDYDTAFGVKKRDFGSGEIESLNVIIDDLDILGKRAVIIDDLCSYGGTFLKSARSLKKDYGVREVILIVTHCEKSILLGEIPNSYLIDEVYTTDTIIEDNEGVDKIKIIPMETFKHRL